MNHIFPNHFTFNTREENPQSLQTNRVVLAEELQNLGKYFLPVSDFFFNRLGLGPQVNIDDSFDDGLIKSGFLKTQKKLKVKV